ncbi:MAG: hypothetical protein U0R52_13450 [Solirubrobacterales bacterium]
MGAARAGRGFWLLILALGTAALAPASAAAVPQPAVPLIASGPAPSTPAYTGHPATPDPFGGGWRAPQNPFMAPNPLNGVHNDTWMTDDYPGYRGPLGRRPRVFDTAIQRDCITLAFDSKGRIVGSCTDLSNGPALYMLDPDTLDLLAFKQMPYVPPPPGTNPALNTTGGAYFYLDNHDRAVFATSDRRIFVVGETTQGGEPAFEVLSRYDPTPCLRPGERMPSVLPDHQGRLWFVGRQDGTVGVLNRRTRRCSSIVLGEEVENSFAIARDGAYVVTDRALYKLRAEGGLRPHIVWQARYENTGTQKTGQINAGSGTTPTLLVPRRNHHGDPAYVAITDNADPLNVLVYRAADRAHGRRRVCRVPVFEKGASADENSLIAAGSSLFAENNYGYDLLAFNDVLGNGLPVGGDLGLVSEPGIARIDIRRGGKGCRKVWTSNAVRPASVVSKGNSRSGILYTFENAKDPSVPGADPWNWVAMSMRTGKVLWKQRAGYGGRFNNHYAGIAISPGPRPTLFLGGVGGIMALRDR